MTPDLLGHGGSDRPRDPDLYETPDLADDCVRLLDHAGIERAHVWGYSRGAWIAEAIAVRSPERVRSLVFGGNILGLDAEFRALVGAPLVEAARSRDWSKWPFPSTQEETAERIANNDLEVIGAAASRFGNWATSVEELASCSVPILAYAGDAEWFTPAAQQASELVGCAFGTVPGDHSQAFANAAAAVSLAHDFLTDRSLPGNSPVKEE
jgi:pimeloyl-ACP methyl ester carboxylesterase